MSNFKEEARKLIDSLPDDSTWDDLMHAIYVRQVIEAGLADSLAGRITPVEQRRGEIAMNAQTVRQAFRDGRAQSGTVDDLRRDLLDAA